MEKRPEGLSPGTVLAGILILSALPLAAVEIIPGLKFVMAPASYAVFHNIAEFFSVMVSLSVFGIGWYSYDKSRDRHVLFLSAAFLAIGMIDFMHALSQVSMPAFITPNSSNKASQFWIAARLLQAAAFLASAYVYAEAGSRWLSKRILITAALLVPSVLLTGIIVFPSVVPATFVPGVGVTSFKRISEYLVIGVLCAATVGYWQRMTRTGERLFIYYLAAFVICIFSEIPLAAYTKVFDTYNVLGHLYKLAAFSLVYYGIYRASVEAPYLRLAEIGEKLKGEIGERKRTEEALREAHSHLEVRVEERTAELAQMNAQLRARVEERRKAEQALRESEERYKKLVKYAPAAIYEMDLQGTKFLSVNDTMCDILGYSREELLSMTPTDLMDEKSSSLFRDRIRKKLAGEKIDETIEYHIRRKDGEWINTAINVGAITYTDEKPTRVVVIGYDITERKRMEEQLREAEEKSRLLIKYAPSMLYEIDFRQPAFKSVNDAMCQFLGYTREELLAISPFDLLDDEGKAVFRERIRRKLAGEAVSDSVEYKSRTKDGREVYGILNMTFTYEDWKPEGAVVVAHDITDRKRAEEALKKAYEELEKRIQERTSELSEAVERLRIENIQCKRLEDTLRESENQVRFFASQCLTAQETERKRIAGELHDSIASALVAMRIRIDKVAEEMKQGNGRLEALQDLGSRVTEINNEVRRIMADLRPSVLDDLGINPAMNWFCREYEKTYSHIRVEKQIDLAENDVTDSLKTAIFRVVQEAMNNIAKHSQANHVNLYLHKKNSAIELTIQDNGQGFDLDTTKRGMGLSTMRERAELSGGAFDIESTAGKGTLIRVAWPH